MPTRSEQAFNRDMLAGAACLKKEIGYNPTRFNQMVAEHGGPDAVRLLLRRHDASDGFTTFWENGRLDMSCEAHVLLPWNRDLFSDEEVAVARRRLTEPIHDVQLLEERLIQEPSLFLAHSPIEVQRTIQECQSGVDSS